MTTLLKYKCLKCGLHFICLTWDKKEWKNKNPHCPECGQSESFIKWEKDVDH